jgi:hypothetical protein
MFRSVSNRNGTCGMAMLVSLIYLVLWLVTQNKTRNNTTWADARNGSKIKENGRGIK